MELSDPIIAELVDSVRPRLAPKCAFRATYRLQFQASQFRFACARELAGYLAALGVSHVYASPCLKARRGSTHGYDIVDHTRLNDELGTDEEYAAYVSALHEHELGQVLDIVPNHMSVATDENAWWMDVLMNGPASPFAHWFDIDWHPAKIELQGKVQLPSLDEHFGKVLESGRLPVRYCDGAFFVSCGESMLPLDPETCTAILTPRLDELAQELGSEAPEISELRSIVTALQHLPLRTETAPDRIEERRRERLVIQGRLRRLTEELPRIAAHVEQNLTKLNGEPGQPQSFEALDRLLDQQAYRLVHWKAGSDELNYRRFFDVTELAAVCMENVDVFEAMHRLLFELAARGDVEGFRIDHIDGLFDPAQYLWRLQWGFVGALGRAAHAGLAAERLDIPDWRTVMPAFLESMHAKIGGPTPQSLFQSSSETAAAASIPRDVSSQTDRDSLSNCQAARTESSKVAPPQPTLSKEPRGVPSRRPPLFVLVEKILGVNEPLPPEWPVEGTTGYDFLNLVNGLFVDPKGLKELQQYYARFVDLREDFREIVYDCKRLIVGGPMHSEVQLLAHRLDRLSARHRLCRDYTLQSLRSALREIMACFPVYRTYIRDGVSERDRRVVQMAVAQARRRNPTIDSAVLGFVRDVLLLEQPPDLDSEGMQQREVFVGRFQQVTSPVMAKGIEDTAFYRYVPLVSLEEVGGEPGHGIVSVDEFHRHNVARREHWPHAMLATTTHDTKRTEDVRARIDVLSEIPGPWRSAVSRWSRWNRRHRRDVDGEPAPGRNDEWLFYQTLAGVWPLQPPTDAERIALIARLQQYLEKAMHEAKLRTSWINPNPQYDEAVREFVAGALGDPKSRFFADFQQFHESIIDAGLYTAASQTLLKLTSPGVPDIYQGQEVWDFSLVDPDNRRPVNFALRRERLAEILSLAARPEGCLALARHLAVNPRDERMKLFVTWTALQFRQVWQHMMDNAEYIPLKIEGEQANHACAFAWISGRATPSQRTALIVAPRLLFGLTNGRPTRAPCGRAVWKETHLSTAELPMTPLKDLFTGRDVVVQDGRLFLAELLEDFPLTLLVDRSDSRSGLS